MSSTRPARLFVAILAALAMTTFIGARSAFSQDAGDSGTSIDSSWDGAGPAIDEDAASADKVLELPQVTCGKDAAPDTCDSADADTNDDDSQAINAPSPSAPPPTLDDDTANSGTADDDWGNVEDYQNQQVSAVPYVAYPYPVTVGSTAAVGATMNRPQVPASAYVPMSSPITQAARPPLNPGAWMTPPTMSAYSRPAGGPMMMTGPLAFHH